MRLVPKALRPAAVALCIALAAAAAAAERVAGTVFLDANANGRLDAGEQGLAGVPVTDGVAFALTDAQGRYELDAALDELLQPALKPILTVTFPSGTWPTAGWLRRLDAAPDPKSVDFGLRREEQPLPFVFVHGTDPHVPRGGKDLFVKFRGEVEAMKATARFCFLTGDLVNNSDFCNRETAAADYQLFADDTRDFPVPLFTICGNHDCCGVRAKTPWDPDDPALVYGLYWKAVGPLRWSFNYAGIHFVGVDFNKRVDGEWVWGVPPSALKWLERDVALAPKGAPVYLFVHFPQGADLTSALQRLGVKRLFVGHSHAEGPITVAGVPGWQSGSIAEVGGGHKPGYRLVLVAEGGVETFYKPIGEPHPIAIDVPRAADKLRGKVTVKGAFYDADAEIERLTVRIGEAGGEVPFRRTPICCRFEVEVDLSKVPAGRQRLRVEAAKGEKTWTYERNALVLPPD